MKSFVLLTFVAIAAARPEPPSGYSYNGPQIPLAPPSSSYGAPSSSYSSPSSSYSSPSSSYSSPSSSYSSPSSTYSAPSSTYSSPPIPQLPPQPSSSYGAPQQQYGAPSQPPVIHKHVYVHVPPPEPEYIAPRKPISYPPPQKHYKIVFIKAPNPPAPVAPVIPVAPQNEEKTLVYVLVKKPDEQPDIVIPTSAPTQPSKPEVYFIRYKTQKQEGYPESIAPAPSGEYGAPSNPPSQEYGAPH